MGWRDILKINMPEDWVEKYLITQEEYDNLSLEEKARYHSRVFQKYRRENQSSSREAKYHSNNRRLLLNNPKAAVNKPHPTEEEDFKHKHGERIVPQRGRKYKKRKKRQNNKNQKTTIRRKQNSKTKAPKREQHYNKNNKNRGRTIITHGTF